MKDTVAHAQRLPTTGVAGTRIGSLAFEGGYPTEESTATLYHELDFQRAVQA